MCIRDRFLDSRIVSPLRLRWVKGVCVLRCNLPPALLAEWPGSFTCHCGNTGVERTPNMSQHTKLTLEKKNATVVPTGIRTRNLSITSPAFLPINYPGSKYIRICLLHAICAHWKRTTVNFSSNNYIDPWNFHSKRTTAVWNLGTGFCLNNRPSSQSELSAATAWNAGQQTRSVCREMGSGQRQ